MEGPIVHLTAGAISGFVNCVALQPLDLIKTRIQQGKGAPQSMVSIARDTVNNSGISGLWRGTLPTIIRNVPGSAMYFAMLNGTRNALMKLEGRTNVSPISNLVAGAFSRVSVGFLLMPFTVLKSRYESSIYKYTSLGAAFRSIVRNEGFGRLFAGFGSTALRDAPFAGIYVAFYEKFKASIKTSQFQIQATLVNLASASAAGLIATGITHPFDVIRLRIQLEPTRYKNTVYATRLILRTDGTRGLFAGMVARLVRKTLSAAITWTLYEEIVSMLK